MREQFILEGNSYECQGKYKRINSKLLTEKRIIGIATMNQVGFIPNLQLSFLDE